MPDNRRNFSARFSLPPTLLPGKDIGGRSSEARPRKSRPLVTACRLHNLLDTAVVNNRADLARRLCVSRARVTQLLGLLRLPAEVRDEILDLPEGQRRYFSERSLRAIASLPSAAGQVKAFQRLRAGLVERSGSSSTADSS